MCDYSIFHMRRSTLTRSAAVTQETRDFYSRLCRYAHRRYLEKVSVELPQNLTHPRVNPFVPTM